MRGIEKWLTDSGIGYKSGIELGNIFLGDENWRERYQQLLESSGEERIRGLKDLPEPICLMCAELEVNKCHLQLIAKYLVKHNGVEIHHIE